MTGENAVQTNAAATTVVEYSKTAAAILDLRKRYHKRVFDVATPKGLKEAIEARAELRAYRVDLEEARVKLKAPILERGRELDSEAKRITAALVELEDPIDAQIKLIEKQKADEKAAKAEAERRRVEAINGRIDAIRAIAVEATRATSAAIAAMMADLNALTIDQTTFAEFAEQARNVRTDVAAVLAQLHVRKTEDEATAARVAEQQEAIAKQLREAERRAAIRKRIDVIRNTPASYVGQSSRAIYAAAVNMTAIEITAEEFGDLAEDAFAVRLATVDKLRSLAGEAEAREAEDKRLRDERERLDVEAKRLADEREAVAAREREAAAAEQQRQQEAEAAAAREREAAEAEAQRRERIKAAKRTTAEDALYAIAEVCDAAEKAVLTAAEGIDRILVICEANLPERTAAAAEAV